MGWRPHVAAMLTALRLDEAAADGVAGELDPVAHASAHGVEAIHAYHYGLARLEGLDLLREALSSTRREQAS